MYEQGFQNNEKFAIIVNIQNLNLKIFKFENQILNFFNR